MLDTLTTVNGLLTIVGGILAISALIVAKKPDAKQMIDKLVPYQALIGVGMITLAVVNLLRMLPHLTDMFKVSMMWAAAIWTMIGASALLGALFGMPQIAKWIPGDSNAENKALELSRKVAPFQVLLGLIGIVASLVVVLYNFKILKLGD